MLLGRFYTWEVIFKRTKYGWKPTLESSKSSISVCLRFRSEGLSGIPGVPGTLRGRSISRYLRIHKEIFTKTKRNWRTEAARILFHRFSNLIYHKYYQNVICIHLFHLKCTSSSIFCLIGKKYQRQLSSRLAILMFRGTPCSFFCGGEGGYE